MKRKTETQAVQLPKQQIALIKQVLKGDSRYGSIAGFYKLAAGNEIDRIHAVHGASSNWRTRAEKQVRASD